MRRLPLKYSSTTAECQPVHTFDEDVLWEVEDYGGTFARIKLIKTEFEIIFECDRNSENFSIFTEFLWNNTFKQLKEFFEEITNYKVDAIKIFDNEVSYKKQINDDKWPWAFLSDSNFDELLCLFEGKRKYYILL